MPAPLSHAQNASLVWSFKHFVVLVHPIPATLSFALLLLLNISLFLSPHPLFLILLEGCVLIPPSS